MIEEAVENLREALEKLEQVDQGIVGVLEVEAETPKAVRA